MTGESKLLQSTSACELAPRTQFEVMRSALHVRKRAGCPPLPPALLPCHPHPPANLPGVIINAPAHVESAVPTNHMPGLMQAWMCALDKCQ